jgi:hypothetical protein
MGFIGYLLSFLLLALYVFGYVIRVKIIELIIEFLLGSLDTVLHRIFAGLAHLLVGRITRYHREQRRDERLRGRAVLALQREQIDQASRLQEQREQEVLLRQAVEQQRPVAHRRRQARRLPLQLQEEREQPYGGEVAARLRLFILFRRAPALAREFYAEQVLRTR